MQPYAVSSLSLVLKLLPHLIFPVCLAGTRIRSPRYVAAKRGPSSSRLMPFLKKGGFAIGNEGMPGQVSRQESGRADKDFFLVWLWETGKLCCLMGS